MGFPIYREVKVWAPESLTHREKLTALVLADDANDETRLTYSSVVDPDILRYALVKNDRDMRKVLARLQDEKVIEQAVAGHNGRIAKYRFLHLDPAGCPGLPKCRCPLALEVQNEPPTADSPPGDSPDVGGPNQTGYAQDGDGGPVQKEPPTDGVGGPNRHRRRSKKDRPTPLTSSTATSSSTATARKRASSKQPTEAQPNAHQVADDLTAAFWDRHGKGWAQPFLAVRGVIRTAIGNDVDRDDLARALHQLALERRPVSGGTLQVALGDLARARHGAGARTQQRGGYRSPIPDHDEYENGKVRPIL